MAERIKSSFSRFITKSSAERKTIKKIEKLVKETQQAELTPEKIKFIRRNAGALSEELRNEDARQRVAKFVRLTRTCQ